jgi:T5SS/PEP-CTERM-associated repeat protein
VACFSQARELRIALKRACFLFEILVAVPLFVIGSSPAEADGFIFTGDIVLVPPTNPNPDTPSDAYYYTQSGSFGSSTNWDDEDQNFAPSAGIYAPSAPGAGDGIGIYGYPSTEFPPDLSGYIGQNWFLGWVNDGFDISGSGTFETMVVVGPGDLNLGNVNITGNTALGNQGGYATSLSSVGGIPSFDNMDNITNYSPSDQNITGSLTTPTLSLSVGTTLEPGNGTTNTSPDPVADAGSMTFDGATITTQLTQVWGIEGANGNFAGVSSSFGYIIVPIELDNSTLTATTELDLIGTDPVAYPLTTGQTEIDASNSTITAGAIVIATGDGPGNTQPSVTVIPGYGSGVADAPAEIYLDGSKLIGTNTGDNPPSLVVGDTGDGALDAEDGSTIESVQAVVGNALLSTGTVTLDDSTWTNTSFLTIGNEGDGTVTVTDNANLETDDVLYVGLNSLSSGELDISDGGTVTASTTGIDGVNSVVVGTDADSSGIITIDGDGSELDSTGDMQIGYDGDGSVSVTDGGVLKVEGDLLRIGHDDGGAGDLEITGSGSKLDAEDTSLYVGYGGTGTLEVYDGATLTVQNTSIGTEDTGDGEMDIDGSDSTATLGEVTVGDAGRGLLTITGGATANTNDVEVGGQADSEGGVLVDGDGSTLTADGDLTIGDLGDGSMQVSENAKVTASSFTISEGADGTGQLTIESGGNMTVSDDSTIGDEEGIDGTVDVEGTSSVLKVNGDLKIGGGGTGELDISDNGSVTVQGGTVGDDEGSQGTVDITGSGSILHSTGDFTIGNSGQADVTVSDGGTLRVDGDLSIGKEAGSDGSLTMDGNGSTLTYSGGDVAIGSSGTGEMTVQNGAFVDLSGTSVNVGDGEDDGSPGKGTLTVTGSGSMLNTGDLSIGSKGTGSLDVEDGGTLSSGDGTVGDEDDSEGDATITGAGSSWTATV